ncbi:hypothetical protein V8G54_016595 [Vigna mungo]|uniref:Uncharacterized protein n=1 Tax=Vigna mungo TaxID=3915 RepID=A0AAQ3NLN4_VIGMU
MENDWPLKSHCGSVTQNKKKKREKERENDTHTCGNGAMVTPQIPDEVKSLEAAVHRSLPEFGCGRTQSKNRRIFAQRIFCDRMSIFDVFDVLGVVLGVFDPSEAISEAEVGEAPLEQILEDPDVQATADAAE